ncbi:MAG: hypothetical protein V4568_15005 [Pseudomonadota bacterium]
MRFLLGLAFSIELRLSALVKATTGHITYELADDTLASWWKLKVIGKGNKVHYAPLLVPVLARSIKPTFTESSPRCGF